MKRSTIIAVCLIGGGILLLAAAPGFSKMAFPLPSADSALSSYSTSNSESSQEIRVPSSSLQSEVRSESSPKYFVSVYDGYVAVFLTENEIPSQILKTRLDSLPEYDQKLLEKGIAAKDERELNLLLQDYES